MGDDAALTEYPFKEIIDFQEGPGILAKDFRENGVPLIRLSGLKDGESLLADCNYLDEEMVSKKWSHFRLHKGDVLLSTSATLGRVAIVDAKAAGSIAYTGIIRMRPRDERVIPEFIPYLLHSPHFQQQCEAMGVGSVIRHFGPSHLRQMTVLLPEVNDQRAIAHILGSLDDKIELNRRMNETLEAMAQALFKSWFVDFDPVVVNALRAGNPVPEKFAQRAAHYRDNPDALRLPEDILCQFPDRFQDSELGPIPEGWEVKSLFELFELIGGGTPKTSVPEYWNGDIPWFSVVDAPNPTDVFVIDTEKHITQLGVEKSSTKILPVGTTIISARGTVGKCALVGVPMATNQSCYGIQGREGVSDAFTYYTIRFQVSDLQRSGHGSVFNTITRETFKSITIPFSGKDLTRQFESVISRFMDQILHNLFQIDTLAKLRDALLPKLISGELRVPDAEKQLEDTL